MHAKRKQNQNQSQSESPTLGGVRRSGRASRAKVSGIARLGTCLVLIAAAVAPALTVASVPPASAATLASGLVQHPTDVPYTVTAAPVSKVSDGQPVTINIKTPGNFDLWAAEVHMCRSGLAYQSKAGTSFADDFELNGYNCPNLPVSSSADIIVNDTVAGLANAKGDAGETLTFRVGSSTVKWQEIVSHAEQTLVCGESNPCFLIVEILSAPSGHYRWDPWVFNVTYQANNPLAGCGGPADGVVKAGGPARLRDAYINWAVSLCAQPGQHGAASSLAFQAEGNAVKSFSDGTLDMAYTAVGYDGDAKFYDPQADNGGKRPSVAIPLALNAAVLAVGNGEYNDGHKTPYQDIRFTPAEATAMIAGGPTALQPHSADILSRNIQMRSIFSSAFGSGPAAESGLEAPNYFATRYFHTLSPGDWKVPNLGTFAGQVGAPRGVTGDLGTAVPSFNNVVSTLSEVHGTVLKELGRLATLDTGGAWVLTDLATARAATLSPVRLGSSVGDFTGPTPEAMTAAVAGPTPSLKPNADGILIPDPTVVAPVGDQQPYPMTFVEYVLVPTQPLVNTDCSSRSDSQTLMKTWLDHALGAGQTQLPDGMLPLPATLLAQAKDRLTQVGAATPTGACAAQASTTTTTATVTTDPVAPPPDGVTAPDSFSVPGGSSSALPGDTSSSRTAAASSDRTASATSGGGAAFDAGASPPVSLAPTTTVAPKKEGSSELIAASVPAYGGGQSSSIALALGALVGLVALLSAAAFASAPPSRSPGRGPR